MQKNYTLRSVTPESVRKTLHAHPELVQTLLYARGIETKADADAFTHPDYDAHTHDPFLMRDMERAVSRICTAIENNERIGIYSDFDCDGIPAATILHDFFTKIGHTNFENYIPHRHTEGYGFHAHAVDTLVERGASLIITVDCGIVDFAAATRGKELGIDVIVTDHHLPAKKENETDDLPDAYAVLNPHRADETYPYHELCGSGVAFKLACGVLRRLREKHMVVGAIPDGWEKWLLDMVGIATIADMVPLTGENRVLARFGLHVLRKTRRPGVHALLRKLRMQQHALTEDDIGFMIAPRINAASRMDAPEDGFRLLATQDAAEGETLAAHLDSINDKRKGAVAAIVKEVKAHLSEREALQEVIVAGNPKWKPALLGLAANTIVEAFDRPVFLWGRDGSGNDLKGSCRSDGRVSVVSLMRASHDALVSYGGHAFSGGFVVSMEQVHELETHLSNAYQNAEQSDISTDTHIDADLTLDDANWTTYNMLEQLAPFGEGNPKPIFRFANARITDVATMGKEKNHLKLTFENSSGHPVTALGFFMDENSFDVSLTRDAEVTLIGAIEKSVFRGKPELRIRIIDIF